MDNDNFTNILAKAQSLMLDEGFNAKVEASARSFRGGSGNGGGITSSEMAMFERQAFGSSSQDSKPIQILETKESTPNFDKLPDAIRESFKKLPPQTGDGTDSSPIGQAVNKLKKNVMTEQATRIPQTVQTQVVGGVDYSLIKMIVSECIKEQLGNIGGNILTESASPMFKGMRIAEGNKIQFLDSKGNLYEGVLKLKKKAK